MLCHLVESILKSAKAYFTDDVVNERLDPPHLPERLAATTVNKPYTLLIGFFSSPTSPTRLQAQDASAFIVLPFTTFTLAVGDIWIDGWLGQWATKSAEDGRIDDDDSKARYSDRLFWWVDFHLHQHDPGYI